MTEFLTASLAFILAMLALGLVRILRGPGDADRMMAAQLIGTGGIASLLLLGAVTRVPAAVDVALTLALLATFASIAFVKKGNARSSWSAWERRCSQRSLHRHSRPPFSSCPIPDPRLPRLQPQTPQQPE